MRQTESALFSGLDFSNSLESNSSDLQFAFLTTPELGAVCRGIAIKILPLLHQ